MINLNQNELQRYIYKIHSSRLREAKWNLNLPLAEARKNNEVISLASSQILRWIDELNGITEGDIEARAIRSQINLIKKQPNSLQNKKEIRRLYSELDKVQFKPDYINIIMDRNSDYRRLCKGFYINGIKYKRLLGTNGGIKNSTIVFVSERLYPELFKRIENGRNPNKTLNPSKLEAYRALTCSASQPVSMPEKILIVDDYKTEFYSDVIYLANAEGDAEPIIEEQSNVLVSQKASDGFGLMSPVLAERWSEELGLDYTMAGCNTRFAFNKGMVFTFDFLKFANEISGSYMVKDAWGYEVDIRDVELILNTSMVKLWSSYGSCDEYIRKSISNKYEFGIAKTCPKELESERKLNYQFIQSYEFSDDDILELTSPTLNEIKDVLGGDWRKTILFLRGSNLTSSNVFKGSNHWIKAIMVDHELVNDSYIKSLIYKQIKNRINEAKIGVIKVHGNYSIISGDPYAFCQHMFGMPVTGILKAGEVYNKYWSNQDTDQVICFRAPMSCHNNIRKMTLNKTGMASDWYQYMDTCTILNAWDTTCAALNGCDFDGDILMLTDNNVLLNRFKQTPSIMCEQKSAPEIIPTEEAIVKSNIDSFGSEIGRVTNYITSMYEVASKYDKDSEEYKVLQYRIKCGQLIQQDTIDAAKGIIAKPMPSNWHDTYAISKMEDGSKKELYRRIVANKKPYFMKYIYPALSKQYTNYVKLSNRNCIREFGISIDELTSIDKANLTDRQSEFLKYYNDFLPVGTGDCVMNKICYLFEQTFDNHKWCLSNNQYDYSRLKNSETYTSSQYYAIKKLFVDYTNRLKKQMMVADRDKTSAYELNESIDIIRDTFMTECYKVCSSSRALYNAIIDITNKHSYTKKFAWDICGETILMQLLENNHFNIEFPEMDDDGDLSFCGNNFSVTKAEVEIE